MRNLCIRILIEKSSHISFIRHNNVTSQHICQVKVLNKGTSRINGIDWEIIFFDKFK